MRKRLKLRTRAELYAEKRVRGSDPNLDQIWIYEAERMLVRAYQHGYLAAKRDARKK